MGNVRIISASAGSGKTYRLAYEYVRSVVADPTLYRHILAVTFTNKATEEMSSRILERLHELATPETTTVNAKKSPYLKDLLKDPELQRILAPISEAKIRTRAAEAMRRILHDYSRFAVLTIDRFFQRLIRAFIRELGVEANFNLELETDSLLELAADALIEGSTDDEQLKERLYSAARDRLDEGRSWDIKHSLTDLGRQLFGSDYRTPAPDTPTLIETVVKKADEARKSLRKTAEKARQTIADYGLTAEDFRGKSKGLTAHLSKVLKGEFIPLSKYARAELENESRPAALRELLAEMDRIHEENTRLVASAALLRENRHNFLLLADLQRQVERICREENIMPISETNRMIARLVGGNDTPFIFEKAGSYFSRFFIDEFQDTSTSQWENFVPLLRDAIASSPESPVMLIGDIKQAIYRWRGGDWQILSRRVHEQMGADRVEVETLDTNHRSMRRVVEFNNEAVGRVVAEGSAALDTMIAEARAEGSLDAQEAAELTGMLAAAYTGHDQKPKSTTDEGYVTLTLYGPDAEGKFIPPLIEKIEELQSRGYGAGDIAVLVRSNTQGARVAQMLLQRKRENPDSPHCYDVVTAEALTVGASAASRFIIACLTLSVDSGNPIQRAVFNRWLGRDFDTPLTPDDTAFFARLAALSPEEAFEETVLRFGLADRPDEIAYVQAVHQQISTFSSRSVADTPLFLKWWSERGAAASITMQGGGAITVSTIHKSKGLQYKVVIVPWLSWSMAPDTRGRPLVVWAEAATEDDAIADAGPMPVNYREQMASSWFSPRYYREQVLAAIDSANLFYVAATRAEEELHLMIPSNPRDGRNSIGRLVQSVMGITEDVTTWGTPVSHTPESPEPPTAGSALRTYPTTRPGKRVRLRLPASRYLGDDADDDEVATLTPRDHGVLMHRAFESARTADDVRRALEVMLADGFVSPAEHTHLQQIFERSLTDPRVAEWFGGDWTEVRNEGDIVLPRRLASTDTTTPSTKAPAPFTRRPDRVMIRDGRAVVVDYKFGRLTPDTHADQLRDYMRLLRDMGHPAVEGYIWYVTLGRIEKIEN
ncbi:MAG: UvrD-helicase domain-containing protein [Alistipes sp.]|jgi:ATP-dependent exoDNAse (exonuclease V) beta subunit|nr:UvrD-helicase domain-containing protein [Alistipes sp.]